MTTDLTLPALDLAQSVTAALSRGRYVLMTDGGGQPLEITLDLKERPDDLFEAEHGGRRFTPEEVAKMFGADDHGPSIPAQTAEGGEFRFWDGERETRVYEFALQDVERPKNDKARWIISLDSVSIRDAPDEEAAEAADWVHVYDRVTRERRTLKRPEPDRILTGLRDVAADLRRGPVANEIRKSYVEPEPDFVADRILTESGAYVHVNRPADAPMKGSPVEPPFGCAALPPVGPLTSTEGLRKGDMVRVSYGFGWDGVGPVSSVADINGIQTIGVVVPGRGDGGFSLKDLAFVGRPDADGWMTWAGGENPVPGAVVEYRMSSEHAFTDKADVLRWRNEYPDTALSNITAFRIVDTPPAV